MCTNGCARFDVSNSRAATALRSPVRHAPRQPLPLPAKQIPTLSRSSASQMLCLGKSFLLLFASTTRCVQLVCMRSLMPTSSLRRAEHSRGPKAPSTTAHPMLERLWQTSGVMAACSRSDMRSRASVVGSSRACAAVELHRQPRRQALVRAALRYIDIAYCQSIAMMKYIVMMEIMILTAHSRACMEYYNAVSSCAG